MKARYLTPGYKYREKKSTMKMNTTLVSDKEHTKNKS